MTHARPSRRIPRTRGCALAGILTLVLMTAASGASATTTPKLINCKAPRYPGMGYFTSLAVAGVSCGTGEKVAVAYYHCRLSHGGVRGVCPGGVDGFRCTVVKVAIPTETDARVTCTRPGEEVQHTYEQDT